jgi:hypothetical protein
VINISNCTCKDNPQWPAVQVALTRPLDRPDVTDRVADRPRGFGLRIALDWLADLPRRWGDRWFAMNDAEAQWWGWQMTRTHGGLGRRYRDPRFDALTACTKCQGAGLLADMPCAPCLGTGRVTVRGVS